MSESPTFRPADIVVATGLAVSLADIRNYIWEDRFNTPMAEPRAGKPRQFPIEAVYEAALLKEFSRYGVALSQARRWNAKILERIERRGLATIHPDGSQSGPAKFGAPHVVLWRHGDFEPLILTDGECGETLNLLFYTKRKADGPAASLCAIHLPALLSPIRRALGVE